MCYNYRNRGVAQLVAHAVWDREVAGSSPVAPTRSQALFDFFDEVWYNKVI